MTKPNDSTSLPGSYLAHEKRALPLLMSDGERLIDHEAAGRGFRRLGLLVLTNRRLMHLHFRRVLRQVTQFDLPYERIDALIVRTPFRATAHIEIKYDLSSRTVSMTVLAGLGRALALTDTIRDQAAHELGRVIHVVRPSA